jgi:hypothetical protein
MSDENKPTSVQIRNPAVIDRIVKSAKLGHGRNLTETAENLVIAGSDALKDRDPPEQPTPTRPRRRVAA